MQYLINNKYLCNQYDFKNAIILQSVFTKQNLSKAIPNDFQYLNTNKGMLIEQTFYNLSIDYHIFTPTLILPTQKTSIQNITVPPIWSKTTLQEANTQLLYQSQEISRLALTKRPEQLSNICSIFNKTYAYNREFASKIRETFLNLDFSNQTTHIIKLTEVTSVNPSAKKEPIVKINENYNKKEITE